MADFLRYGRYIQSGAPLVAAPGFLLALVRALVRLPGALVVFSSLGVLAESEVRSRFGALSVAGSVLGSVLL